MREIDMAIKNIFIRKVLIITASVLVSLGGIYYLLFTLDTEYLTTQQVVDSYQYSSVKNIDFKLDKLKERLFEFSYKTFDGTKVKGQINYPDVIKDKYPVLIGIHSMGCSYPLWWTATLKGRPTVTQVNIITDMAIDKGYVVIAIDIADTHVVGYSMGGQLSLLLAGVDKRISNVLSIVPPYLSDTTASVAPKNIVSLLDKNKVWLVTSDDDENANEDENLSLFNGITTSNKKHLIFDGNHILPEGYVEDLSDWF